jgi:hypothetical protein
MQFLVRQIQKGNWVNVDDNIFKLSSDVLTSALKTQKDTLSVWQINSENDLDEAVLAIVSNFKVLESIDVVILDGVYLLKANVEQEQTNGRTPVTDLINSHYDLKKLDYYTLGLVAEHIIQRVKINKIKRYSIKDLKTILKKAISDNRLKLEDLKESVAELIK